MEDLISIRVNGESREIGAGSVLFDAIERCDVKEPFAVAVNRVLVTKAHYRDYKLSNGDSIDIVYPMQGG
ncbi:sulfur carrier protein ThiS [Candidatus Anaplasma sp. TIGMIC]|uniref:sulfur carrier protein ThiS n=1 Tax=Candidatus Anaplasma sp. TIGMIC TaxID=3020713 RepID=UPI00232C0384|nr:sulfur carrier protein ThiS [Candidatus Anaplasma sp. TIGMIC]MDB1135580.1 sulfur carrier protein ThiS [Candidatus Anaplasma sp. TIGMIC]